MRPIPGFPTGSTFRLAGAALLAALAAAPAWANPARSGAPAAPAADAAKAAAKPARDGDAAASKDGDPALRAHLQALGYKYEVDEDGDFVLTFALDEQRSQMAYVLSRTQRYGSLKVREIWSPAYRSADRGALPAAVANRLLEDGQLSKLGGWVSQDGVAVFVVKLDADASQQTLDDAIDYAVRAADQMEAELTPGQDEF
ncbi:hypothetical protein SAMN04487939_10354 [Lysobacter sp. yr284]|uniref:hypothetical protein n=1 Tax=Lysobacter sp. yr284 TaxID=1761791 RepID=UPI00089AC033|nr:hypothetical protein [Lysobacter sp. yr284]SDY53366.1 hypothetical protein SAMN04487939_10354 [Lysobacter sp. yr284]